MLTHLIKKVTAGLLIYLQFLQIALALALPQSGMKANELQKNNLLSPSAYAANPAHQGSLNNTSLSSQQLGLGGPFNLGLTHSDLTGTFFNAHYVLPLGNALALGFLGEYGSGQYRYNGTVGYEITPQLQMKVSGERLAQRLPFQFDSGAIDTRVHQDAYGARFQQLFDLPLLQAFNTGAYYAKAANKALDPVIFTSNGSNCNGFNAGLQCINYRNIAGATSLGIDAGADLLVTPITLISTNLYYDEVRYNPNFTALSNKDRDGFGAGIQINQLLNEQFKLVGEASAREIYNTYQAGLSWLPQVKHSRMAMELSLLGQHIASHNDTPNNNSVSLQISFLADGSKQYDTQHFASKQSLASIAQWTDTPAVKMQQVLAVAEQITKLLAPGISSISPNSGTFAGGNTVTILGTNFIPGLLIFFGEELATNIQVISSTQIQAVVPASTSAPSTTPEAVTVTIQNPDGQQNRMVNGYTYVETSMAPTLTSITPNQGTTTGGQVVTIVGTNLAGVTAVLFGTVSVVPSTVSATQITAITPPNTTGTVDVTVTSPQGSATLNDAYTYLLSPPRDVTISPDGSILSGVAQPTTTVTVTNASGQELGSAPVANDGSFSVTLNPPQTNGQVLSVAVTDTAGNVSTAVEITAPDISAPLPPTNLLIDASGTTLTGNGEAGTTVTVSNADGEVGTATVAGDGSFSVTLNPPQRNGQELSVTLTDAAGNVSPSVSITAPDTTAPLPPTNLMINSSGTTLTGNGEAGTTVTVRDTYSVMLATGTVPSDGSFSLTLVSPQTDGQVLSVTLTDAVGNVSLPTLITAPDTRPAPPTGLVINSSGTELTGLGLVGALVTVRNAANDLVGTATVTLSGDFSVSLSPPQTNGEVLSVTQTDTMGKVSTAVQINAPDITAPAAPTNLQADATRLTGNGEPGTKAFVSDSNGTSLGIATVDSNGFFMVTFTTQQVNGTTLSVILVDSANNQSPETSVQVVTNRPAPPTGLAVDASGQQVLGIGAVGTTVHVKNQEGIVLGTALTNVDGSFIVNLNSPQINGQVLSVALTDNTSGVSSLPALVAAPNLNPLNVLTNR